MDHGEINCVAEIHTFELNDIKNTRAMVRHLQITGDETALGGRLKVTYDISPVELRLLGETRYDLHMTAMTSETPHDLTMVQYMRNQIIELAYRIVTKQTLLRHFLNPTSQYVPAEANTHLSMHTVFVIQLGTICLDMSMRMPQQHCRTSATPRLATT